MQNNETIFQHFDVSFSVCFRRPFSLSYRTERIFLFISFPEKKNKSQHENVIRNSFHTVFRRHVSFERTFQRNVSIFRNSNAKHSKHFHRYFTENICCSSYRNFCDHHKGFICENEKHSSQIHSWTRKEKTIESINYYRTLFSSLKNKRPQPWEIRFEDNVVSLN